MLCRIVAGGLSVVASARLSRRLVIVSSFSSSQFSVRAGGYRSMLGTTQTSAAYPHESEAA
jgi:hypothetical protein